MSITFFCRQCGSRRQADDAQAGSRGVCENCGAAVQVPTASDDAMTLRSRGAYPPPPNVPPLLRPVSAPRTVGWWLKAVAVGAAVVVFLGVKVWLSLQPSARQTGASRPAAIPSPRTPAVPTPWQPVFPARGEPSVPAPGVRWYQLTVAGVGPGLPTRLWLYLPAGRNEAHSLPCVLMAPAGTRLIHGMELGEGDQPEHLPYVRAGFAVVVYELSGNLQVSGRVTFAQLRGPVTQFMAARGGLANAQAAIEYVLSSVPEVDTQQLFAAGHSSAATMALNVAAADHRVRGCVAYAPRCDARSALQEDLGTMERLAPGVGELADQVSPIQHVSAFDCPVFLFHADDDGNVPTSDNETFDAAMRAAGKQIKFERVPTGNHYDSMIEKGIPAGIAWMKAHGAKPLPPA